MDAEDKLDIRPIEIAFRDRDRVLISGGIKTGERLVVSRLATPVQGMPLRTPTASGREAASSLNNDPVALKVNP